MRCIASFEGLLARSLLLQLCVNTLAVQQALPYLRSALAVQGGSAYLLAVVRLEAIAAALPSEWFQGELSRIHPHIRVPCQGVHWHGILQVAVAFDF
jgi:hypothetical protein